MRIAFLGTGFVADFYATTLVNHPELELAGVFDRDAERARQFASARGVELVYPSFDAMLADDGVDLVVNLTNPRSHFTTTRACLTAGKHVYSEKPLAMEYEGAEALVRLAEEQGLTISGAPCNVLGETAQTAWKALRDGLPGRVRAAYAEIEDGPFFKYDFRSWRSSSGAPWPFVDEFETGVTLEHAAYLVAWLAAFFGPVRRVTAFAATHAADLAPEVPREDMAPDFTVACLEFDDDVVARVTCGRVAPGDRTLRVFGDKGILTCGDAWSYSSPVSFVPHQEVTTPRDRLVERTPLAGKWRRRRHRLPLVRTPDFTIESPHNMDFSRGVAEQAAAIREGREPRLSGRFALHVNEVVLAMQPHSNEVGSQTMRSDFGAAEPMPWAR